MQERLLCSRMLHFTKSQLCWECSECPFATEEHPEGMPEHGDCKMSWTLFFLEQGAASGLRYWEQIIQDFTDLRLTCPPQDRLIALSAIAERFAEILQGTYVAGLFLEELPRQLLWAGGDVASGAQFRLHALAPSWSWASRGAHVHYLYLQETDEPLVFYHDSVVDYVDSNSPFGATRSARLDLRGRLLPAKLERVLDKIPNTELALKIDGLEAIAYFGRVFDTEEEYEELGNLVFFLPVFWTRTSASLERRQAPEKLPVTEALAIGEEGRADVLKRHELHGLVLVPAGENCYRRLYAEFTSPAAWLYCWARQTEQIIQII